MTAGTISRVCQACGGMRVAVDHRCGPKEVPVIVAPDPAPTGPCQGWALCHEPAVTTRRDSILGEVPVCGRHTA